MHTHRSCQTVHVLTTFYHMCHLLYSYWGCGESCLLQHFYNTKILQNRTNSTVVFWQNSIQCCKNVALKNAMVVNSLYNLCKIRL